MVEITPDFTETRIALPREKKKEMLSVSTENGKTLVRINSSSLDVIQTCMRKSLYVLQEGWKAQDESPATLFGSAIHAALEVFYSAKERGSVPKYSDMELMSYGHKIEKEETNICLKATRAFINKAHALNALPETDKRSIQNGVWILFHYFSDYINDPHTTYVDDKGPFTERGFTLRIHDDTDLTIDLFGTIDLVLQDNQTGKLLVCDHKTSSRVGSDFYNRLKPNHQYTGYLLGAREVFGIETNDFLVNCVEVKAKPKTARGSKPNFPRQITTRTQEDFEEFKDTVLWHVVNYINALDSGAFVLGNVNSCAMYLGCQFLDVCSAPKSLRDGILKAKFVKL